MKVTHTSLFLSLVIQISLCMHGDPMFVSPYEERTANTFPVVAHFPPERQFVPQPSQTLIHKNPHPTGRETSEQNNFTFHDFIEALNEASQHQEDKQLRTAGRDDSTYQYSHPSSYGYPTGSNYGSVTPTAYHKPEGYTLPANPAPTAKIPLFKPELLDLMKPVTTKVATKMNGLVGLVMSLLTGTVPGGLQLQGFKDLLINGILKPLFVVKGGIKALISKLAIPVISLLLINVEVLITVWWLWEVCPDKTASYPYKPSPEYNSYS